MVVTLLGMLFVLILSEIIDGLPHSCSVYSLSCKFGRLEYLPRESPCGVGIHFSLEVLCYDLEEKVFAFCKAGEESGNHLFFLVKLL